MRGLAVVAVATMLLVGCSDTDGDGKAELDPVAAAEQRVERAETALTEAQAAFEKASSTFCDDSADYIQAVDHYGGVFSDDQATVGDVKTAGADLTRPRDKVTTSAEAVVTANETVADAEKELADAQAALAEARTGSTEKPDTTTTTEPTVPKATVERVEQAEADLAAAFGDVSDSTTLADASEQVNAAAFAVEVSWLRLFADAGCLSDDQHAKAVTAVTDYTAALQTSLVAAGFLDGPVDGIYGPATVAAVEKLQTANDLPVTGLVDKATAEALTQAVVAAGGDAATEAIAHTAALQSLLTVAGYWTGPIDGQWTDDLTAALKRLQNDLGVKPTGEVDAETLAAIRTAIEEGGTDTTTTEPERSDDSTTTTAA